VLQQCCCLAVLTELLVHVHLVMDGLQALPVPWYGPPYASFVSHQVRPEPAGGLYLQPCKSTSSHVKAQAGSVCYTVTECRCLLDCMTKILKVHDMAASSASTHVTTALAIWCTSLS
jgi:hypothetical protein